MPIKDNAFTLVHNKLLTHLILQQTEIPMPLTYLTPTAAAAKKLLKKLNYPIVMKFQEGTHGKGVMFAESYSSASSMLDALGALKQPFLIQEYIDTMGADVRAFVVGDEVVASMKRQAKPDENIANIHAGGEGKRFQLDRKSKKIAIDAARALGASVCGIDMLEGSRGSLVLEANISPSLQAITEVTKVNIAEKIAIFLEKATKEFLTKKRLPSADELLQETKAKKQEFITNLTFRGDRIVLPEIITRVTKFNERDNYTFKVEKGKLIIEEFNI